MYYSYLRLVLSPPSAQQCTILLRLCLSPSPLGLLGRLACLPPTCLAMTSYCSHPRHPLRPNLTLPSLHSFMSHEPYHHGGVTNRALLTRLLAANHRLSRFRLSAAALASPAFNVQQRQYICMFPIESFRVRRPSSSERQMQIHCHPPLCIRVPGNQTVRPFHEARSTTQKPRKPSTGQRHDTLHISIPGPEHIRFQMPATPTVKPWPHGQVPRQCCDNSLSRFRAKTFRGRRSPPRAPVSVSPSVSMRDHDTPQRVLRPSVRPYTPSAPSALSTPGLPAFLVRFGYVQDAP
ncbi:hypothetical protein C8Q74DRAFT_1014179 [Fomes fomentarius]|nr:hypothetical protein C8Q74DRAFT_1014179 [Fomes fomentarius]